MQASGAGPIGRHPDGRQRNSWNGGNAPGVESPERFATDFHLSEEQDKETDERRPVNEALRESLAACRFMLAGARANLSANSNEPEERNDAQGEKSSGI